DGQVEGRAKQNFDLPLTGPTAEEHYAGREHSDDRRARKGHGKGHSDNAHTQPPPAITGLLRMEGIVNSQRKDHGQQHAKLNWVASGTRDPAEVGPFSDEQLNADIKVPRQARNADPVQRIDTKEE